ncbi:MAG: anthranilate synthase component I [Gammaproteobacteria bacterium]
MLSAAQYDQYARSGYNRIPLTVELLTDLETPLSTYLKVCRQAHGFLFESLQGGETWGRYSIIGLPSKERLEIDGMRVRYHHRDGLVEDSLTDSPLEVVREYQQRFKVPKIQGLPRFSGGLVGYFGYNTVHFAEPQLRATIKPKTLNVPDIVLMVADELVVFDNLTGRATLIVHGRNSDGDDAYDSAIRRLDDLVEQIRSPLEPPATRSQLATPLPEARLDSFTEAGFKSAVNDCLDYIRKGDAFQIVLSHRMKARFTAPPIELYRALRTLNPSPYMFFIDFEQFQLASSSPEILVRVVDGEITSRPLAGTRRRGDTPEQDAALAEELLADPKELAEHLMLIDLGRNDVGRISQYGSVKVTDKMKIEKYSHVMHIVSNVNGRLDDKFDSVDVLRATFPAGTLSGAPKIRALEIIEELEPDQREIYSGAIGYLGWHGTVDTAIASRTAVIKDQHIYVQAGAGIVADSKPQNEWQETLNKSRGVFAAAELASRGFYGPIEAGL